MTSGKPEKDNPQIQKMRIEQVVSEISAKYRVVFYVNSVNPKTTDIRFKIYDKSDNKIVFSLKQDEEWASSEVADKSDSELRERINELIRH